MSNEIQKDDFILPGILGRVLVNGEEREIIKIESSEKEWTMTIGVTHFDCEQKTEDAEFEVIQPKQLPQC